MFLLTYYAIITVGTVVGGKILSVCLSDDKGTQKKDEDKKQSLSLTESDYEPQATRPIEWGVLI
jgi:hypothetical protein